MFLTNHTIAHSVKIANIMSILALKYDLDPKHMYILGLLHDIGKLNTENTEIKLSASKGHAFKGGEILKEMNFPYWKEVYNHGHPELNYHSKAMNLLNAIDLSVNSEGMVIGQVSRLRNIEKRYGKNSEQFLNARLIVDYIKENEPSLYFPSAIRLLRSVSEFVEVDEKTIGKICRIVNGEK